MADLIDSMLDLMRRLPPPHTEENVAALVGICPEEADELLQSVDQPLQVKVDRATGREYLACDYNRDGESYRCVYVLSRTDHDMLIAHTHFLTNGLVDLHGQMNTIHRSKMATCLPLGCENLRSRQMKPLIHIGSCTMKAVYRQFIYGTQKIRVELEALLELLSLKRVRIGPRSIVKCNKLNGHLIF